MFLVLFSLFSVGCGDDYEFGISQEKYPQHFPGVNSLNNLIKYNKEFNTQTSLQFNDGIIRVEHGVIAEAQDIKRFNIPNGNYIFSNIVFDKPQTLQVEFDLKLLGKDLAPVGSYILRPYVDENCKEDESKPNWEIIKMKGSEINERCPRFGLIKIFEVQKIINISKLSFEKSWFKDPIQQTIKLKSDKKLHQFNFELVWHPTSSFWHRMLSVT